MATRQRTKLGATTKRAKKIRRAKEFPLETLAPEMRYPLRSLGVGDWNIETIKSARDSQLRGDFWSPVLLAKALNSDAALFTARLNRLAPMRGLPIQLDPADQTARSLRIRDEGEALFGPEGIACQRDEMVTLHKQYVDHSVAIGFNVVTPRPDGSRVDFELRAWPLEFVRWLPQMRAFYTLTYQGQLMKIEHGDGRWVVFQQEKLDPWADGCVVPGSMLWADRAFGIRDRSNASRSHGQSKMIGEMPEGVAIQQSDGRGGTAFTAEAQALLGLLQACHVGDLPYGLRPAGSKTDQMVNTSQAWQIWNEIIKTNDQDSARIYLGQDGTTTNAGGDYIKSERLFGVRNDLVEADIGVFREAIKTGTIEPWCAVNFGDSKLAPTRKHLMPDADEDARRTSIGEHQALFYRDLQSAKDQGFVVDQPFVDQLARTYGVMAPRLPEKPTVSVPSLVPSPKPASSPAA